MELEELGDVHDVPLGQAQLPLQHLPVPVDAFLGEGEGQGASEDLTTLAEHLLCAGH